MNLKTLDDWFSKYIRLRDSDDNGYGECISCGKRPIYWKDADAGHYVNRRKYAVRYNEKNVNFQCRACNRFQEGNAAGYTIGLTNKHGPQVINELYVASKGSTKWTPFDISVMVKFYKAEVKKMMK